MARHSRWAQIKRQKGATDVKRGALFTKLANAITAAARSGGDPQFNFKLRLAIEAAKNANMPKDNVERAIKRGAGELAGNELTEARYEAFGPGGAAMIIEALTDNKNRTVANLKQTLNKHGGRLGGANSVAWMFERHGIINASLMAKAKREELELKAIEAGAEDIQKINDHLKIVTAPENLEPLKNALENLVTINELGIQWLAKEKVKLTKENEKNLEVILEKFNDDPDITAVYTNYAA